MMDTAHTPEDGHASLLDGERYAPVLGKKVKRLREEQNLRKYKFAIMANIGRPFLNKIEKGKANPKLSVIVNLADALGTTPAHLLEETPDGLAPVTSAETDAPDPSHARL